jgi:hypothetical protein
VTYTTRDGIDEFECRRHFGGRVGQRHRVVERGDFGVGVGGAGFGLFGIFVAGREHGHDDLVIERQHDDGGDDGQRGGDDDGDERDRVGLVFHHGEAGESER